MPGYRLGTCCRWVDPTTGKACPCTNYIIQTTDNTTQCRNTNCKHVIEDHLHAVGPAGTAPPALPQGPAGGANTGMVYYGSRHGQCRCRGCNCPGFEFPVPAGGTAAFIAFPNRQCNNCNHTLSWHRKNQVFTAGAEAIPCGFDKDDDDAVASIVETWKQQIADSASDDEKAVIAELCTLFTKTRDSNFELIMPTCLQAIELCAHEDTPLTDPLDELITPTEPPLTGFPWPIDDDQWDSDIPVPVTERNRILEWEGPTPVRNKSIRKWCTLWRNMFSEDGDKIDIIYPQIVPSFWLDTETGQAETETEE